MGVSASEFDLRQAQAAHKSAKMEFQKLQHKFAQSKQLFEKVQARLANFVDSCAEFERLREFSESVVISGNHHETGDVAERHVEMAAASSSSAGLPEPLTPEKEAKPSNLRRPTTAVPTEDHEDTCLEA